jgi:hypothetical protein
MSCKKSSITKLEGKALCHNGFKTFLKFQLKIFNLVEKNTNLLKAENLSFALLKSSRNEKDLNDVTAAPLSVSFSQLAAAKKHQKRGSCDVIKVLLIS